jgi:hypothetical protein
VRRRQEIRVKRMRPPQGRGILHDDDGEEEEDRVVFIVAGWLAESVYRF